MCSLRYIPKLVCWNRFHGQLVSTQAGKVTYSDDQECYDSCHNAVRLSRVVKSVVSFARHDGSLTVAGNCRPLWWWPRKIPAIVRTIPVDWTGTCHRDLRRILVSARVLCSTDSFEAFKTHLLSPRTIPIGKRNPQTPICSIIWKALSLLSNVGNTASTGTYVYP
jgi:hypothetical protein